MITFKITISTHQEAEEHNTFTIKIIFRWRTGGSLIPHPIKNSRIVFGYLWPNRYYQIPEEETVETEYCEMLFRLETEHSDKELYRIIAQLRPVQMISY